MSDEKKVDCDGWIGVHPMIGILRYSLGRTQQGVTDEIRSCEMDDHKISIIPVKIIDAERWQKTVEFLEWVGEQMPTVECEDKIRELMPEVSEK